MRLVVLFLFFIFSISGCATGKNQTFETHNVTSYDQGGGITAHTVNIQRSARHLTQKFIDSLNANLPRDKTEIIVVTSVWGDQEALQFAHEIKNHLESRGWEINGVNQVTYTDPIIGQHARRREDGFFEILVGSNN